MKKSPLTILFHSCQSQKLDMFFSMTFQVDYTMKKPSTSPIPTLISKVTTTPANVVCSKWKPGVWARKNAAFGTVDEHDGSARRMGSRSLGLEKVERTWRIIPVTKYHVSLIFKGLFHPYFWGETHVSFIFSILIWLLGGGPRVSSSDHPPIYWRHKPPGTWGLLGPNLGEALALWGSNHRT